MAELEHAYEQSMKVGKDPVSLLQAAINSGEKLNSAENSVVVRASAGEDQEAQA